MDMAQASGTLEKLNEIYDREMEYMQGAIDDLKAQLKTWKNKIHVFCKHFLDKVAKHFWTLLQVQIGQSCKASTGSYPASRIAIADHI